MNYEPPSLELQLQLAEEELARWKGLAANEKLSPKAQLAAMNQARSYQAAVQLGKKALAYQQESRQRSSLLPASPTLPDNSNSPLTPGPPSTA